MALSNQEIETLQATSANAESLTSGYLKNTTDRTARVKALTAAKNLVTQLQDGDDAFFYRLEQVCSAGALRFLMSIGVHEAIPSQGHISASELAAKLGCEVTLLIRIMRIVVATGVFDEVDQDVYAHTKRSINLLDPGYGYFFEIMMDEFYSQGALAKLPEYYSTHEKISPNDPKRNPYSWAFGMEGHDWHEVLSRTPENVRKFGIGLSGKWSTVPATGAYPFGTELAEKARLAESEGSVLMVDIGGALGGTMKEIREAYPELKGKIVVQDQQRVINGIPEDYLPATIEPMSHDFFTPQPVKAKVYYLRRTLHDWNDEDCTKILGHQADAMDSESVLLISEIVVPDRVQTEDTYVYWMDLTMLMFAGKERSAKDWQELLDMSGLELVKIWESAIGTQCVIEGRKKRV